MTTTFIDIHPTDRTFRVYTLQGCSHLYHMDELRDSHKVFLQIRNKLVIKVKQGSSIHTRARVERVSISQAVSHVPREEGRSSGR